MDQLLSLILFGATERVFQFEMFKRMGLIQYSGIH